MRVLKIAYCFKFFWSDILTNFLVDKSQVDSVQYRYIFSHINKQSWRNNIILKY